MTLVGPSLEKWRSRTDEDTDEKQKVCAWPSCQCELGGMCSDAVANAFAELREHQEKLAVQIRDLQETLNSRMPRGRL
jgi:hypothetical protein